MFYAIRSATLDIIASYCFAHSYSALTFPSFQHPILTSMDTSLQLLWVNHALPFLPGLLNRLPQNVLSSLTPAIKGFLHMRDGLSTQIDGYIKDPSSLDKAEQETVFHHLLRPAKGQPIPSKKSLLEEVRQCCD